LTTRFPLAVGKGKGDAGRRWACSKTFTDWFKNAPPGRYGILCVWSLF
jgi:hypothetical protein